MASAMQSALAEMVRNLSDKRIRDAGLISINHVELNSDMGIANVYVSFIGADSAVQARAVAALSAAKGRLRGPLGRKLGLRHTPQLRFFSDESLDFRERLADIINTDKSRGEPDVEAAPAQPGPKPATTARAASTEEE